METHLVNCDRVPIEIAIHQVWTRECPRCKAILEKEEPAACWKCPRCGWE